MLLANLVKLIGRVKDFDWLILVLTAALTLVFLILVNFDGYTFEGLWEKFLVLTISAFIINFAMKKAIEDFFIKKKKTVNWRNDRAFMMSVVITSAIILISFLSYSIWYTIPRDIDQTHQGIHFQLGEGNQDYEEPVTIRVKGDWRRSLSGGGYFDGNFEIVGDGIRITGDEAATTLRVLPDHMGNRGYLHYRSTDVIFNFGDVYMEDDFEAISVARSDNGSWTSSDGWVISAPANTRDQGLELANELHPYRGIKFE